MKISNKIVLSVAALVGSVAVFLGAVAVSIGTALMEEQMRLNLSAQARQGAKLAASGIAARLASIQIIADSEDLAGASWETQRAILAARVRKLGYLDMAVIGPDGKARYALESTEAALGDRDYFKSAMAGTPAVSDVLISRVTGKPVVIYAVPMRVGSEVVGALMARAGGEDLGRFVAELGFGASGYAYMVNAKGVVIAHPRTELVLQQFAPIEAAKKDPKLQDLARTFERLLATENGFGSYFFNDKRIIAAWHPVSGTTFKLAVTAERSEFFSGIARLRSILLAVASLCMLIGCGLAFLLGKGLARPIRETTGLLGEITRGDGDLTRRLQVHGKDEIGELAANFNGFVDGLREMILAIHASSEKLNEGGTDIAANMEETSACLDQVTRSADAVKDKAIDQSAGVTETLATVREITRKIESFKARIDDQAANVTQASASIHELVASIRSVRNTLESNEHNIKKLTESSAVGKEKISSVAEIIRRVGTAAEGMLEASSIIASIASQTNLLSMNAAIEAAHAGDAGRGFAVVADEIRKLAENSNEQAKSISKVLSDIKSSIDSAVSYSREADASFDEMFGQVRVVSDQEREIKNAMTEQSASGDQVLDAVVGINQITNEIHDGAAEILVGSQAILEEMDSLASLTQGINQAITEVANGTKDITGAVGFVTELSVENKKALQTLEEQVARFKI